MNLSPLPIPFPVSRLACFRVSCRVFGLSVLLVLALGFSGCSAPRFRAVDYEAALARAKAERAYSNPGHRAHTLTSFDVLTLSSLIPDPWTLREAVGNIEGNASGDPGQLAGAVSLATWEGTRVYLGETFERAYASFVGGTAYWMLGETDNAAALWRNTLDIDRESEDGFREDFAVANYLLAKYNWHRLGQRQNAELYLQNARRYFPTNPYLAAERVENDNLVVLVEVGEGPRKVATGPQGAILGYEPGWRRGGTVGVGVDGQSRVERSAPILDLYPQARYSRRFAGKRALQLAKGVVAAGAVGYGVYKLTDSPVLGIFAGLFLKTMPADLRQWHGVPAQVQLVSFRVEPGTHTLRLRAPTGSHYLVSGHETVVGDVEVLAHRDTILLIRPVPGARQRHGQPPASVPPMGIRPDAKARAAPGSPILDLHLFDADTRKRSPLYKYLPSSKEIEADSGVGSASAAGTRAAE